MGLGEWLARKRKEREARRLLEEALRTPAMRQGTSLKLRHASRCVLVDHEEEDDKTVRIRFGILRHPRPYAFSRQSHKVMEYYVYEVPEGRIVRLKGLNLTRLEGKDASE